MTKYSSARQRNLKVGIVSYTESNTVLQVTGRVGIGTTNASTNLDVAGDIRLRGGIYDNNNTTGLNSYVPIANGFGGWSWQPVTSAGAGTLSGITIEDEGSAVGFAGSITTINFVGLGITATASGAGATVSFTPVQGIQGLTGTQGLQGVQGFSFNRVDTTFTATGGQTTFSVNYSVGNVDVYLNGARLSANDYTATNGTSIVLNVGAGAGDIIDVIAFESAGPQGTTGTQGTAGVIGVDGSQGTQGVQGTQGIQGIQGSVGTQGTAGVIGFDGSQGTQGVQGIQGIQGVQGNIGVQGNTGSFGGAAFDYTFDTTITNSDPGQGKLRFNQTGINTSNYLYIHSDDDNLVDITNFLQTIDDSTSAIKGHFTISEKNNTSNYSLFSIVGLHTEYTNYFAVPVAYVSGVSTSFSNNLDIIITFARTGDTGDTGAQGTQGIQGLTGTQGFSFNRTTTTFNTTDGQTTFSVNYSVGNIDVYLNGNRLSSDDYTASNGTSVILTVGASNGDTLDVVAFESAGPQGIQGIQGIGNVGSQGTQGIQGLTGTQGFSFNRTTNTFTATEGQTTFAVNYSLGNIEVFLNGTRLNGNDYTASNGTSIILNVAASAGDIIDTIAFESAGPQGLSGTQGTQGTQGIQGTVGIQGTIGTTPPVSKVVAFSILFGR